MAEDLQTAFYLEINNTKLTTPGNTIGTMTADQLTPLCLESNNTKHTTPGNTIGTMRKRFEIILKLKEYEIYIWSAKTREDIVKKIKEIKLLFLTIDENLILNAFQIFISDDNRHSYKISIVMIMFHILSTSPFAIPPILIQKLLTDWKITKYLGKAADTYFDIFYQGLTLSESIHTIHDVWKSCSTIEVALQMTYCGILLEKKEYKKLKYLVSTETKFFESNLRQNCEFIVVVRVQERTRCISTFAAMLYILHCSLFSNQSGNQTGVTIGYAVQYIQSFYATYNISYFYEGFYNYLMLPDKDQMPCTKPLIHQLLHAEELNKDCTISAIIKASVKLMEDNYYDRSKKFLQQNLENLKDVSIDTSGLDCKTRRGYSLILLLVLHDCCLSKDTYGTELAIIALHSLKVSLLDDTHIAKHECYCYMGSEMCRSDINICRNSKTLFGSIEMALKKYSNLYRRNKKNFVKKLKELNGKLNIYTCINKKQKLDIKIEALSTYLPDWLYPSATATADDDNDGADTEKGVNAAVASFENDLDFKGSKKDYFYYIFAILGHVADDCKEANKLTEFLQTLCQIEFNPEMEDLCTEAMSNSVYIKLNQHNKKNQVAQFVLDINKEIPECSLLTKLTLTVGKCLHFDENTLKDKKKVIYKCFCKVRHAVNNGDHKDINSDEYREVFTFIKSMEKEEEMEKLVKFSEFLILLMLLLMGSTYGGHHKSAEMKKYLSLKYEYDKAILYLLWCSGDVEINPGPTLRKLKTIPASQKLRAWIWDMCSILLKILKEIPVNSKPKDLWKDKPANWPCDQPFYDPRNKSKRGNEDVKSDDSLLKCILDLCNEQELDISQYQMEITAWRAEDKTLLFERHTCRKEIQIINTAIQCLIKDKDTAELQHMLGHIKIQIDFSVHNVNNGKQKGTTDIIRGVAVIFCKICLGIHPMEKTDGIWRTEPTGWITGRKFYDPNNAGKRIEKDQDKNLVNNLVEYIETENINIPPEYTALVTAWKQHNMPELCKIYTVHTNVAVIENAFKYLQLEGLLDKPDVLDKLKQHGLTLSTEWFNRCSTSTGICDSNQASTSHRSTYVNQSIAQQNSANLNSKGQNGSQPSLTDNSIHAPSYRKRSNKKTSGIQEAKCQNKKRKYDENVTMKKKRQKQSSINASLPNGQTSCTDEFSPDPMRSCSALQGINTMDFWFATTENLANDSHNETVPSTECENQYTPQPNDYHSLPPIPGIDSLLQELDQNYGSIESPQEQPVDNNTISVSTGGQSDGIVAQNNQTTVFPSGGQSMDKVPQGNQTMSETA